jgi:hypothetical protein
VNGTFALGVVFKAPGFAGACTGTSFTSVGLDRFRVEFPLAAAGASLFCFCPEVACPEFVDSSLEGLGVVPVVTTPPVTGFEDPVSPES